jgi:hypothetical protein
MNTKASIVGVYPVPNMEDPVFLVEMSIENSEGVFDVGLITQEDPTVSADDWQVPYDERIYSFDGTEALTEQFDADRDPELWDGSFRLLFFFHYLNIDIPLSTPFGKLTLPIPTELPQRLVGMEYEDP